MISADQLSQCNARMQQAKGGAKLHVRFGDLGVNLCGDFLQLPPVDIDGSRHSLARSMDDVGNVEEEDADDDAVAEKKRKADVETLQGHDLWRSVERVVCLYVNVRAPDVLGRLQMEMRAGHISDEVARRAGKRCTIVRAVVSISTS